MEKNTCLNCNTDFEGVYCSNCGQFSRIAKIDNRYLFKDVPSAIFNLEHGFWYTIFEILKNPARVAKNYISGKRISYYKPISMLLLVMSAYTLLMRFFVSKEKIISNVHENIAVAKANGYQAKEAFDTGFLLQFVFETPTFTYLILLPFYTLGYKWAFRKKYKLSFGEQFYLNVFMMAYTVIVLFVPNLLSLLYNQKINMLLFLLYIPFYVYFYYNIYKDKGITILGTSWRVVLANFYMMLLALIASFIGTILYFVGSKLIERFF